MEVSSSSTCMIVTIVTTSSIASSFEEVLRDVEGESGQKSECVFVGAKLASNEASKR